MKITTTVECTDERIADLLCSAIEGGSNYWYMIEKFVKPPVITHHDKTLEGIFKHIDYPMSPGGALIISSTEGDEINGSKKWRLDRESIEKGLQVMATKYPRHFSDWMQENDDANTGDCFLQCCLFGEEIYG